MKSVWLINLPITRIIIVNAKLPKIDLKTLKKLDIKKN